MEIKCDLICTRDEFLLLGSTESLLKKLGFELCVDLVTIHKQGDSDADERHASPLRKLLKASDNTKREKIKIDQLSDALLTALHDILDLKHRVEEEPKDGKGLSKKEKRKNHKVDSLEKQRAKLLEKQNQDGAEEISESNADDKNCIKIRDAWIRIARAYNSLRLLLFLFSDEKGLDIVSDYHVAKRRQKKEKGIKDMTKQIQKLSYAFEVMIVSFGAIENSNIVDNDNDGDFGMTMDLMKAWGKSVNTSILSRRKHRSATEIPMQSVDEISAAIDDDASGADKNDNDDTDDIMNESVIELTDDSSSDSNADRNDNDKSDINITDDGNIIHAVNDLLVLSDDDSLSSNNSDNFEPIDNDAEGSNISTIMENFKPAEKELWLKILSYWNSYLGRLMTDLISKMSTDSESEVTGFLDQAFGALSLDDRERLDTTSLHERAKELDEKFSLVVGITGSREYKKRQKYLLSIEKLRHRIEQRIRQGRKNNPLADARLDVYGSCLSGLSLGKNADVDLSLTFPEAIEKKKDFEAGDLSAKKYSRHVTDTVFKIKRKLESSRPLRQGRLSGSEEFCGMEAIPRARVPVIKGVYMDADNPHSEDGSLHFDICLLNDIAVANSGLIKEYSDVDIRVKSLMIAIKRWAKDNGINTAQDKTLSSYTWMNMVIFFLQCIEFVPNLQCPILMKECNHSTGAHRGKRRQDNINNLDTAYLKWKGQADQVWKRDPKIDDAYSSVSILLYHFFRFYSQVFPIHLYMISIKRGGKARLPKTMFPGRTSLYLCIEDPFETYDSHFPHDLGSHADAAGSIFISICFRNSTEHLSRILFGETQEDEIQLWPVSVPAKELERSRIQRKAKTEKRERDPNTTLVIEIFGGNGVKKQDVLKMFRKFADETKSRIVGSHLTGNGRLAFVDYDSVEAVHAALMAHAITPLELNGNTLSVSQKKQSVPKAAQRSVVEPKRDPKNTKKSDEAEKTVKDEPKADPKADLKIDPKKDDNDNSNKNTTTPSSDVEKPDSSKKDKSTKGDPDKTLVVRNFARRGVSEGGLAKLFRPFADRTSSKLVSADLVKKKTTAFIQFDSSAAVQEALREHSETPLKLNGKVLDVVQKLPPGWKRREKIERGKQPANAEEEEDRVESNPSDDQGRVGNQTEDSQPDPPKTSKRKTPKKGGKKNSGNQKGTGKGSGHQQEKKDGTSSPPEKSGGKTSRGNGGKKQGRKKPQDSGDKKDTDKQVVETNRSVEEQL